MAKLSAPFTMTSYCATSSIAFSEVIGNSCPTTRTSGLYRPSVRMADWTFDMPTESVVCRTWRWRLLRSTTSKSTMPMVPTPARARYRATGPPSPPAPTTNTFVSISWRWPRLPIWGMMIWRLYRLTCSGVSWGAVVIGSSPSTLAMGPSANGNSCWQPAQAPRNALARGECSLRLRCSVASPGARSPGVRA